MKPYTAKPTGARVKLLDRGPTIVAVCKEIRAIAGCDLRTAVALATSTPSEIPCVNCDPKRAIELLANVQARAAFAALQAKGRK
jgi:arginine/ornithine N-succinyltransferase beta subunit